MCEYVAIIEDARNNRMFPLLGYIVTKENANLEPSARKNEALSPIYQGNDRNVINDQLLIYFKKTDYLKTFGGQIFQFMPGDALLEYISSSSFKELGKR